MALAVIFSAPRSRAQTAFNEDKLLWVCAQDTALKLTFRYSNYASIIEITGPLYMDSASVITGELRISAGSFEQQQLSPQELVDKMAGKKVPQAPDVQSKAIRIAEGFYSKQFYYYNSSQRPFVSFEGSCRNAKMDRLDEDLKMSPERKKELLDKSKELDKKPQIKTKTAVIGDRG